MSKGLLTLISYDVGVKRSFAPNWCLRIAPLQSSSRNSTNIRNPLIYCVNRYFLMFGGSQVQKPYHASMNGFLTFWPWHLYICPRKKDAAVEKTLSTMTSKEMKNDSSFTNSCSYSDVQAWNLKTEQEISEWTEQTAAHFPFHISTSPMTVATVHSVHLPLSLKCWKKHEPGVSRLLCYYITFPRKLQHIPNTVLAIISPNLYNIGVTEQRISELNSQTTQACSW